MKGIVKKIEPNIYRLESGKYLVEMNYLNPTTNKKSKKREVKANLSDARKFKKEFKAKNDLKLLPVENQKISLGFMLDHCFELKQACKSFESIQRHLREIGEYFGHDRQLKTIQDREVRAFTQYLKTREKKGRHRGKLSNQTIDHVLKELRFLLRAAKKQGHLQDLPEVKLLGDYGYRKFSLTLDQFQKVIEELPAEPLPHRAMLWMALNTGQRRTDLANMTWGQVNGDRVVYKSSKSKKEGITAPLMEPTKKALERLRQYSQSDFIFPNPKTGKPYGNIRKALASACERAGVERFTMHTIRHLATTALLEETDGDRDLVARVIGWSNPDMIDRYGHIGNRAISAFGSLEKRLTQNQEAVA